MKLLFLILMLPMVIDAIPAYQRVRCYWKVNGRRILRLTTFYQGSCSFAIERVKTRCFTHFNGPDRVDICEKTSMQLYVAQWPRKSKFTVVAEGKYVRILDIRWTLF